MAAATAHQPTQQELLAGLQESTRLIQKLKKELAGYHEPIAIVGMGCRFPGGADTPEAFWRALAQGQSALSPIPWQRWGMSEEQAVIPTSGEELTTLQGHYLPEVGWFDAHFFGLSPREAAALDPQQQLLLEIIIEALEHANQPIEELEGSRTGLYIGLMNQDHLAIGQRVGEPLDVQVGLGGELSFLSGRIAYLLGLRGPCMTIGTACSSSLVTTHLACQALRNHECDLALSGGVSLHLTADSALMLNKMQATSPDGRCKTFDASADGYGRGEGCGVIVLKRLSDAVAAGDLIWAVIRGSAVNHDGRSGGLTIPSGQAQEQLLRQALTAARIDQQAISYVEAHGTGTALGDPIELRALGRVIGQAHTGPLWVGSVKTNIGHLEPAAGVAGLIKVALALHHRQIPPHLHFHTPNPHIPWAELPFQIPTTLTPWVSAQPRLAGISSFGLSGINAHAIVEEAPARPLPNATSHEQPSTHLLTLSAKDPQALQALAQRYLAEEQAEFPPALHDLCYTSHVGRSHYRHRLSVVAASSAELSAQLTAYVQQAATPGVQHGLASATPPKVAFLFTGQGAQYVGMAQQLYATQPIFRAALDQCDTLLQTHLGVSILQVLYPTLAPTTQTEPHAKPSLDATLYTQPALFALEYALAQLWLAWGVTPNYVMGHSVGEYVAACLAGVFSLADALKLLAARARLMQALPSGGVMVALTTSELCVQSALPPYQSQVAIAAINAPASVVISGERTAVEQMVAALTDDGIKAQALAVSHAFHSPLMQPILAEFRAVANTITYQSPKLPLVSNLTGQQIDAEIATPDYWVRHIIAPVRFADGVATLHQQGVTLWLEIGPKPTLLGLVRQCLDGEPGQQRDQGMRENGHGARPVTVTPSILLPSLRPNSADWSQLLSSLGELYVQGVAIDWRSFDKANHSRKVVLPTYPFQRQRFWTPPPPPRVAPATLSPLIDQLHQSPLVKEITCQTAISVDRLPWLTDHQVYGQIVAPAAYQLATIFNGAAHVWPGQLVQLDQVVFPTALRVSADEQRTWQMVLTPNSASPTNYTVQAISFAATDAPDQFLTHATAELTPAVAAPPPMPLAAMRQRCLTPLAVTDAQARLAANAIQLGPSFDWLNTIWRGEAAALAHLTLPSHLTPLDGMTIHPGLLDSCFQLCAAIDPSEGCQLPFAIASIQLTAPLVGTEWWCYVEQRPDQRWDICLLDAQGHLSLRIEAFEVRPAPAAALAGAPAWHDWLYEVVWQLQPLPALTKANHTRRRWLILADRAGLAVTLADRLRAQGDQPLLVYSDTEYQQPAADHWLIRPDCAADYQKLWSDATDLAGVIHLWSLQESAPTHLAEMNAQIQRSCASALSLLQSLGEQMTPPPVWFVTQGTQSVIPADQLTGLAQAPLWGLVQVATLEQSALTCLRLDLDEQYTIDQAAAALCQHLSATSVLAEAGEERIALRGEQRYVARLTSVPRSIMQANATEGLRSFDKQNATSGTVLITGGLGGLGLAVARWLVEQGARHLALVGRRPPTPAAQEAVAMLQQQGAHVHLFQADVTDEAEVAALLAALDPAYPLCGIIHAAGVLDDALLAKQDWARFERVLRPKVLGAWHLHQLTRQLPLDFFVLFSSNTALLGNAGQANYAAANAWLDALAHQRRAAGLPALSINWGPWAEIGMAAELGRTQRAALSQQGVGLIAPADGLASFAHLMNQNHTQIGVMAIQWRTFLNRGRRPTPYLQHFVPTAAPVTLRETAEDRILAQLAATPAEARWTTLVDYMARQTARILRLGADTHVDPQLGLIQLGLDSLLAVELRNALSKALRIQLALTALLDSSLSQLATLILPQLTLDSAPATSIPPAIESADTAWAQVLQLAPIVAQSTELEEELI